MAAITVAIPDGTTRRLRVGKVEIECQSVQSALDWADAQLPDPATFTLALAILLAKQRPTLRGKTLTVNFAAPANLVTVA